MRAIIIIGVFVGILLGVYFTRQETFNGSFESRLPLGLQVETICILTLKDGNGIMLVPHAGLDFTGSYKVKKDRIELSVEKYDVKAVVTFIRNKDGTLSNKLLGNLVRKE